MQSKIQPALFLKGRTAGCKPLPHSTLGRKIEVSPQAFYSTWVQNNQLFQRHPRLQFLQGQFCTAFHHLKQLLSYVFVSGLHRNPFVMSRLLFLSLIEPDQGCEINGTEEISEFGVQIFNQIAEPNIFSWNTMIRHFATRDPAIALHYYMEMIGQEMFPDEYTFPFLLQACGSCSDLIKQVHSHVERLGFDHHLFVQNSILTAYLNCGCLMDAWFVFNIMPERDIVSWTSLISGLVSQSHYTEALHVFKELMTVDDGHVRSNAVTIVSAMSSFGNLGSLDLTRCMHGFLEKGGWLESLDVSIVNSLVDAYAKCGSCKDARKVFDNIQDRKRDLYSWTSIISGYAMHGRGIEALDIFSQMGQVNGLTLDKVTFIAILSACSHSGLVQEALFIFEAMNKRYGIDPDLRHYGCIVDLLGRAGMLERAYNIIENMPVEPNLAILGSLLNGCRLHENLEIAEAVSEKIEFLKERRGAPVLLSNMYANENKWSEVVHLRKEMRGRVQEKPAGRSWIQVKDGVHEFVAGNKLEVQASGLFMVLEGFEKVSRL